MAITETRTVAVRTFIERASITGFDDLPLSFNLVQEVEHQRKTGRGMWVRDPEVPVNSREVRLTLSRWELAAVIASGAEKLSIVGNYTIQEPASALSSPGES